MKHNKILLNLIVATAVSLIVNFAYMLSIWVIDDNNSHQEPLRPEVAVEGVVWLSVDGHGYLVCDSAESCCDSVYISNNRARRFQLQSGMKIVGSAEYSPRPGGHKILRSIDTVNGEAFDYSALFQRPDDNLLAAMQLGYYLLLALLMCTIFTFQRRHKGFILYYGARVGLCALVALLGYYLLPVYDWRAGEMTINAMVYDAFNPMVLLQCSFAFVVCALYGLTWMLMVQRGEIRVEMEHLKTEATEAKYAMLVNQINPHFLFNSLNSLSMLVREGDTKGALGYIDRLSYTYRYIIRTEGRSMVSLDEELSFFEAYRYLLEVRYADKLFFDIEIPDEVRHYELPALSLQPLIENAVKHNSITSAQPLTVTIRMEGSSLVVSNPIRPKLDAEESTGVGLRNLTTRWSMLTGQHIEVSSEEGVFRVVLPLKSQM